MFRNLSLKKRSVIFNWLISYLVFLIIFCILSFLVYINTSKIIDNEVNKANLFLLNSIRKDIDKPFDEARKIGVEAIFNLRIQNLLNLKSDLSDSDYYNVKTIQEDFKLYMTTNDTIDDIYIMLNPINKVVSSWGIKDTKIFYQTAYSKDEEAYKTWLKEYDERKSDKYSLVFTGQNNDQHKILYIRALSTSNNKDLSNSITISINEAKLIEQLESIDKINYGTSFIYNNGVVVTSSKPVKLPEDFKIDPSNKNNILYTKINGKNMVVSFVSSQINNWQYVTVVPEEVFLAKVNRIKNITYTSIFICFMLGIGLIYFFLKVNYNPINKLLSILGSSSNFSNQDGENNEYVIIEKGLKKVIADKEAIADQLTGQKQLLKSNFLGKLLKGSAQFEIPINEAVDYYNLQFISDYFSAILFYLEEVPEENCPTDISFSDILFIFSNVTGELIEKYHKAFMVEIDNSLVCLVNINKERLLEAKTDLARAIEEAQKFIYDHFKLRFTVTVSNVHQDINNIHLAYREALDTMNYKRVLGIRNTLFCQDMPIASQGTFYYPIIKEQQLINVIKSGDYTNSVAMIEEIYEVNFKTNEISADLAQCLMLNLVSTVIRAVNEVSAQYMDNLLEDLNPISTLLTCKSTEDLKHQLDKFIYSFCRNINKLNKTGSNWIVNQLIPYIKENYSDENLSIALIAEKFDVHPVYISRAFKDASGEGLLDYIHKFRIEKAKELLAENKDCSMEEIGKLVGFTNYRSFNRVFKKYEGVAPGKYKEILTLADK